MGIGSADGGILLSENERHILFVRIYLTNRWSFYKESFYVIPYDNPQLMLLVPGSSESLFVIARTLEEHDRCISELADKIVPAYGTHVEEPFRDA